MNNGQRTGFLVALALLVAACFTTLPASRAADMPVDDSEEVSQLLADVKTEAYQLERDAEDLSAWARSKNMSWESHTAKVNLIREHVNKAGELLTELNNARDEGSPWQQKAIDEIYPALKSLADNTQTVMNLLGERKHLIRMKPEYREYATTNHTLARELRVLVTDYIDYGKHNAEFQRLQQKLQVVKD